MGFSGGGSNILKPHTHDSTILQDGGNLDFKNITQGDMSAGSMCYSNGSHLQELVKPVTPANEVLTFATAGTTPTWATDPFLTSGKLVYLGKHENTTEEDTFTFTFDEPIDFADYACIQVYYNYTEGSGAASFDTELILDGNVATNYSAWGHTQAGSTLTGFQSLSQAHWIIADAAINASNQPVFGNFKIPCRQWTGAGDYPAIESNAWGWQYTTRTFNGVKVANLGTIASITFTSSGGGGSGWEDGFFYFYGVKT